MPSKTRTAGRSYSWPNVANFLHLFSFFLLVFFVCSHWSIFQFANCGVLDKLYILEDYTGAVSFFSLGYHTNLSDGTGKPSNRTTTLPASTLIPVYTRDSVIGIATHRVSFTVSHFDQLTQVWDNPVSTLLLRFI